MIKKILVFILLLPINLFSNNMYGDVHYKIEILNNRNEIKKIFTNIDNINKILILFDNVNNIDENKFDNNLSIHKIINYYESEPVCVCEFKRKKFDYYKEKEIIIYDNYEKIKIDGNLYKLEKESIKIIEDILE